MNTLIQEKNLLDQYKATGYVLVKKLFSSTEIAQIRDAFMDASRNGPVEGLSDVIRNASPDDPLAKYPRMMHPHNHSELIAGQLSMKYMLDTRIYEIVKMLFNEEPVAAQSMFYFKPPGARGQELHQDNFYLRVKPGTCMAAWIAIDDVDEENGGMKLVAGSNKADIVCPQAADIAKSFTTEYVPVPEGMTAEHVNMQAGDVLFFNGSVIHGSTPNTSKERFRRSLIFHYVPKASSELSSWYKTMDFNKYPVEIPVAIGGGPCGTVDAVGPH